MKYAVVPVLLGSLARLPAGLLADRFGSHVVFTVLMLIVAVPTWFVPSVSSYYGLLLMSFFLGLAGASFPIGVGYVSRWTPPGHQGRTLGLCGIGTIGQSVAIFGGPLFASLIGWQHVFHSMAIILVGWAIVWSILARDAPGKGAPQSISAMLRILAQEPLAWILSLFYFFTFGGFVAFSLYLPTLLVDQFSLTLEDAGFRAAGFVMLATFLRPVGGWLADRIGGAQVLSGVFLGVVPFALLLTWSAIIPFTIGALGCAALLGLGSGAIFKLVPEYFPQEMGAVTGLVGAMGGIGGFFPPLLLGFVYGQLGVFWPGFVLLAASAAGLWTLNRKVFLTRQ